MQKKAEELRKPNGGKGRRTGLSFRSPGRRNQGAGRKIKKASKFCPAANADIKEESTFAFLSGCLYIYI
jgi:hypothetical protein